MNELHLSELCTILSGVGLKSRLEGEDRLIRAVNTLDGAREGELSFLSNEKYLKSIETTHASAIVVKEGVAVKEGLSTIRCDDPYGAVTAAIVAIHGYRKHPQWGISEQAFVHTSATIGKNANIASGATVAANVTIGDNCNIYPGCYVADGATLGDDCTLFPNVVVYDGSVVGSRVTIHAGSSIGEDGLGYAPIGGKWVKIPQIGRAIIQDDVEIGANCAIDRATMGETVIGAGSKFGNVVVVGHGTKVGEDCIFVGVVGVAGSADIGKHVTLAGHVGVAGHLSIGDNVTVAAKSGVSGNVKAGATVLGAPAIDIHDAKRCAIAYQKMPAALKRLKALEKEIVELRKQLAGTRS